MVPLIDRLLIHGANMFVALCQKITDKMAANESTRTAYDNSLGQIFHGIPRFLPAKTTEIKCPAQVR